MHIGTIGSGTIRPRNRDRRSIDFLTAAPLRSAAAELALRQRRARQVAFGLGLLFGAVSGVLIGTLL